MGIATDLALALDPVILARALGLDVDGWQAAALKSGAKRALYNCCRQSGKSTVAAVLAVHTALYTPSSLVLLLSPGLRQSQELFRKCLDVYRAVAQPVPADAESTLRLELRNGSRIISLPGKEATIRGYSGVRLLILDEASRVPDDLYWAVQPMLAVSGGRLLALSTPLGKRGWWYTAWNAPGTLWEKYLVPATECPRITPETLLQAQDELPWQWYIQEYMCEFLEPEGALFSAADIESLFAYDGDDVQPFFAGGVRSSGPGPRQATPDQAKDDVGQDDMPPLFEIPYIGAYVGVPEDDR